VRQGTRLSRLSENTRSVGRRGTKLDRRFSFCVVFISAPLNFDLSGTVIAGIPWNPHFTDLRVSITNPTNDDYSGVDLAIQPDKWNYKAAILESDTGCQLNPMGGNSVLVVASSKGGATKITTHRVGESVEGSDNAGDVFEHFISEGGYRLICTKLPSHFTVQIVFALVNQQSPLPASPRSGGQRIDIQEWAPKDATANKFDLLGQDHHQP
jgi:hypothetical protein